MRISLRTSLALLMAAALVLAGAVLVRSATTTLAAGHPRAATASRAAAPPVKLAAAKLLVNSKGLTLYVFALDKKGKSACYGACAQYWPPVLVPKGTSVAASVAGITGKFGVTTRKDEARQLTFDGAPLYTFASDTKPGQMNGQGFQGLWWAVATAPASAPSSSGGSSGGGGW